MATPKCKHCGEEVTLSAIVTLKSIIDQAVKDFPKAPSDQILVKIDVKGDKISVTTGRQK